jgi:hypothetical protein
MKVQNANKYYHHLFNALINLNTRMLYLTETPCKNITDNCPIEYLINHIIH